MTTTPEAPTAAPVDDATSTALIAFRAFAAGFDHLYVGAALDFRDALYDATMSVTILRLQAVARALGKSDPSADRWQVIGTIATKLGNEYGNAQYDAAAAAPHETTTVQANGRAYTLTIETPYRVVVRNSRGEETCTVEYLGDGRARVVCGPQSWTGSDFETIQAAAAALFAKVR